MPDGEMEIAAPDGTMLAVEQAGEGPPIVLLHGLTATRRYVVMGSRLLERAGHRMIAYDARGHGRSSPAPAPDAYGYDLLAGDLEAVMDALGVQRAVLAGASMGAHTIVRFALRHPDRIAAIMLITPAFDPDAIAPADASGAPIAAGSSAAAGASAASGAQTAGGAATAAGDAPRVDCPYASWDALARGLRKGGVEGFIAAYDFGGLPERWRQTVLTVVRQRLSAHLHPQAVADALEAVPRSAPFAAMSDLSRISAPTIVVASRDESDPGHPLSIAERYATAIEGAKLLVEEPGASPIAWQGAQLSRALLTLARN